MPKIRVIDNQTAQTLFECSIGEAELAYQHAAQLEELGLDVKVIDPTLSETLTASLGLSKQEIEEYKQSMDEEIEHHEGSCCAEETTEIKHH